MRNRHFYSRHAHLCRRRFEIEEQDLESYVRAADVLNFANTDVVCLQHEYGIYGGTAGSHILSLVRDLRMPVVTTLHTVLREPNDDQKRVLVELAGLSARVVVMTERARAFLRDVYDVPDAKIDLIAHGIPDTPFVAPDPFKEQFGVEGRPVALTFGLLSPNKGIEHALRAVPEIIKSLPDFVYIVLGATHPALVRDQGEKAARTWAITERSEPISSSSAAPSRACAWRTCAVGLPP